MRVCEKPGCDRVLPDEVPENRRYCSSRCRTAHWRLKQEAPKRVKPSGRQVSYRKAVEAATALLFTYCWEMSEDDARALAKSQMAYALPERQRMPR